MAGEFRQIKKAARKTLVGKAAQYQSEKQRIKSEAIIKANMKQMVEEGEDSWESAEDDAPAIRLEDLLDGMKINDDDEGEDQEEESKNTE